MSSFYGKLKRRGYFEGWYFKQQNKSESVALIPAFHVDSAGRASASLQVITGSQAYHLDYPAEESYKDSREFLVHLGNCTFSGHGCKLDTAAEGCTLKGSLRFGPLTPPAYDMMGPFHFMPFMECRHSVLSLFHRVDGVISVNGRRYFFENSLGYLEGDRGFSFPRRYLWTHCSSNNVSVMLSVAEIPYGPFRFIGCTGFFYLNGKEQRIATYCGAKLLHISDGNVLLKQGAFMLKIKLLESRSHPLRAPQNGSMSRIIHESASCRVQYTCWKNKTILFDFISEQAGFENNWRSFHEPFKK